MTDETEAARIERNMNRAKSLAQKGMDQANGQQSKPDAPGDPTSTSQDEAADDESTKSSSSNDGVLQDAPSAFQPSPQQQQAIAKFIEWFEQAESLRDDRSQNEPIKPFVLSGYAGTGKTTMIRHAIDLLKNTPSASDGEPRKLRVLFGAYTGKAALVMQRNGIPAQTLHSILYVPIEPNKQRIQELTEELAAETNKVRKKEIRELLKEEDSLKFRLSEKSPLYSADLLVLDECSMVNDEMLADIQSFRVPVIALGDPGQLPPIDGQGALFKGQPDALLTEIHRQAEGDPIISMATRARNNIPIPMANATQTRFSELSQALTGRYRWNQFALETLAKVDQILTGKNKTRRDWNNRIRQARGFELTDNPYDLPVYPEVGEKLICLKNNQEQNLFNGLICYVREVGELHDMYIELRIETESAPGKTQWVKALRAHFDEYISPGAVEELNWYDRKGNDEFDFGYVITVHKSQGSQWDSVALIDDKMLVWRKLDRAKWMYTAVTRAAEKFLLLDL